MATLYELSSDWQLLINLASAGEIEEDVLHDTLDSMSCAIGEKAEGYAIVDLELAASEEKLANEIKRLQARKSSITKNRKRIKDSLRDEMIAMGKEKIKTDKFTVYVQNNPPKVEIQDDADIPYTYYVEQKPKLDKIALMDDLKRGKKVKGAEITQSKSVRIR